MQKPKCYILILKRHIVMSTFHMDQDGTIVSRWSQLLTQVERGLSGNSILETCVFFSVHVWVFCKMFYLSNLHNLSYKLWKSCISFDPLSDSVPFTIIKIMANDLLILIYWYFVYHLMYSLQTHAGAVQIYCK